MANVIMDKKSVLKGINVIISGNPKRILFSKLPVLISQTKIIEANPISTIRNLAREVCTPKW